MNITHDFDELVERRGTDSKKYSVYPDHVIPMWIADSDFKAPQPVVEALISRAQAGIYGYPPISSRLKKAAASWQGSRFGWHVDPDWVEYIPGVIAGIICAVRALSRAGDNLIVQTPCYPPFRDLAHHNGRHILANSLILKNGRYEINFDQFEEMAKDPRTRLFILCNPQNPTGRVFTREELMDLGRICMKHHVTVLSDEIHQDLVYSGCRHIPFASVSEEFSQNSITFINPSKTFNVPGLRTGALIAPNPVLKNAVHDVLVNNKAFGENIFGTTAFCTAYEQCAYYADQMIGYVEKNRDLVEKTLNDLEEIRVIHAEGTYLLWLDCRKLSMTQPHLDRFFEKELGLGFNSGTSFGPEGEGFLRMNIACPRSTVREALRRMSNAGLLMSDPAYHS